MRRFWKEPIFAPQFFKCFFKLFVNLAFRTEVIEINDFFYASHLVNMLSLLINVKNWEFFHVKVILNPKEGVHIYTFFSKFMYNDNEC